MLRNKGAKQVGFTIFLLLTNYYMNLADDLLSVEARE